MKIYELLNDESKWIKNNAAVDSEGNFVSVFADEAVGWCLLGAAERCYNNRYVEINTLLRNKICKSYKSVINYNDNYATYQDIINLCKELDI